MIHLLVNLKKASQTIGSTGETLNFVRHSDQKPKAKVFLQMTFKFLFIGSDYRKDSVSMNQIYGYPITGPHIGSPVVFAFQS